jgi:hypothetical protein
MCTTASTTSAIWLVRLSSLTANSKPIVTLNNDVASGLSLADPSSPAFSPDRSASISEHAGITAAATIPEHRVSALSTRRAAIISHYFCITTGSAASATSSIH